MAKKSLLRKVWDGLGSVVSFPFKTIGKAVGAIGNKFPGLSRGVKLLGPGAAIGTLIGTVGGPPGMLIGGIIGGAGGVALGIGSKHADKLWPPFDKICGAVNTGCEMAGNFVDSAKAKLEAMPQTQFFEKIKAQLMAIVMQVVQMLKGSLQKETEKNAKISRSEKSQEKNSSRGITEKKDASRDTGLNKIKQKEPVSKDKTAASITKSAGKGSIAASHSKDTVKAVIGKSAAPKNINIGNR